MSSRPDDELNDSAPTIAPDSVRTVGRYRILRELGAGGMGRVYLAYDQDLHEQVALKLIRPEYTSPDAEERFKREISLARRVTHRNVIRIHDTGIADGTRFISMPFIEGEDLASVARRERLPLAKVIDVVGQVCEGLGAAHEVDVVHRDLKPANIMLDRAGQAYIMDFGLAYVAEAPAISAPGTIVGTVDYMSPEQARGDPADHRSDIYAVGVIAFYLLTGTLPFEGGTAMSRLGARLHRDPPDITAARPDLPPMADAVVRRCLAVDPDARYQSARDVKDAFALLAVIPRERSGRKVVSRRSLFAGAGAIVVVLAAIVGQRYWPRTTPIQPSSVASIAVAALPFTNASGDPAIDWLGHAVPNIVVARVSDGAGVRVIPPDRVTSVMRGHAVAATAVGAAETAARVREFTGADAVLAGQYVRVGDHLRIDATVRRVDGALASLPSESASVDDVDAVASRFAAAVAKSLGVPEVKQAGTLGDRPGAISRLYREGVELNREGKYLDATKRLVEATTRDERFAEAWAALASAYQGLRQERDAVRASQRALDLSAGLSPRERFRILALHATTQRDNRQAIDAYEQGLRVSPNDGEIRFALANLYEAVGTYDSSRRQFAALLAQDPQHVDALLGAGRLAIRTGAPADAIDPLTRALSLAIRLDNDPQRAAAHQALGVAYKRLNRPVDALAAYEQALVLRRRLGLRAATAASLSEIGQVYVALGKPAEAERRYRESLDLRRELGDRAGEANTLIELGAFHLDRGDLQKSVQLTTDASAIARALGNEATEALCLRNLGISHRALGQLQTATLFFDRALEMNRRLNLTQDIASTLHELAIGDALTGDYALALRRLTEALELRRKLADARGIAHANYELSVIHGARGRFHASLEAARDANATVRPGEDPMYPEIAARYAEALAAAGDCAAWAKGFEEPAKRVQTAYPHVLTHVLHEEASAALACGNGASALRAAEEAARLAARSSSPQSILLARLHVARAQSASGRMTEVKTPAADIAAKADRAGLRPIAATALIELAAANNSSREYSSAQRAAERALNIAEKTESWLHLARANYQLAVALRGLGRPSEAAKSVVEAKHWVDEIRRESGTDAVLNRPDLQPIIRW